MKSVHENQMKCSVVKVFTEQLKKRKSNQAQAKQVVKSEEAEQKRIADKILVHLCGSNRISLPLFWALFSLKDFWLSLL